MIQNSRGPWKRVGPFIEDADRVRIFSINTPDTGKNHVGTHTCNQSLAAAAPKLLDSVKALVKHMLTHNIDGGQANFDAGGLLDELGVPRDFSRTEAAPS